MGTLQLLSPFSWMSPQFKTGGYLKNHWFFKPHQKYDGSGFQYLQKWQTESEQIHSKARGEGGQKQAALLSLHTLHPLHSVLAQSSSSSDYQPLPSPPLFGFSFSSSMDSSFPRCEDCSQESSLSAQSEKDGVGRGLAQRPLVLSSPTWTLSLQHPLQFHLLCALIPLPLVLQTSTASALFSQTSSLSSQSDMGTLAGLSCLFPCLAVLRLYTGRT